jgi:hypothetical protein
MKCILMKNKLSFNSLKFRIGSLKILSEFYDDRCNINAYHAHLTTFDSIKAKF